MLDLRISKIGRFTTRDTMGNWEDAIALGNPYTYVGNNPYSRTDPPIGISPAMDRGPNRSQLSYDDCGPNSRDIISDLMCWGFYAAATARSQVADLYLSDKLKPLGVSWPAGGTSSG